MVALRPSLESTNFIRGPEGAAAPLLLVFEKN